MSARVYWPRRLEGVLFCNGATYEDRLKIIELSSHRGPRGDSWVPPRVSLEPVNKRKKADRADIYCGNNLFMTGVARDLLEETLEGDGEFLAVEWEGETLWLFNVLRTIDAFDASKSSNRGFDLINKVGCWFREERLGNEAIFRQPKGTAPGTYVTQRFVDAVTKHGLTGCHFQLIWDAATSTPFDRSASPVPEASAKPPETPKPPAVESLTSAEETMFTEMAGRGALLLGPALENSPHTIVAAIDHYLSQSDEDTSAEEISALAALLGEQYVRQFGWHRVRLRYPDGEILEAVVDQDTTIGTTPTSWLNRLADDPDSVNILLSFNMLAAGKAHNGNAGDPNLVT
jgi:hypothetical protein